jgi:hypothetical protein
MKNIYFKDGPPSLTAGIAGPFNQGKSKPVSDKVAAQLLARTDIVFQVAGPEIPADTGHDITALEVAALEADKADFDADTKVAEAKLNQSTQSTTSTASISKTPDAPVPGAEQPVKEGANVSGNGK